MHAQRRLRTPFPEGWVLCLTSGQPERLVVFVHGFRGRALGAWQRFPASANEGRWWSASDMLFVGYDSVGESIVGVAARLRRELPRFYPRVPDELLEVGGERLRAPASVPYRELILVGHSLGGVVVRRALSDAAHTWMEERTVDPDAPRPVLLDADVRLFSPASAGVRLAGWLGFLRATSAWGVLNVQLRRSSAYTDLQQGSQLLRSTRRRTERFVADRPDDFSALRAALLWANPENVVLTERYDSDRFEDSVDNTSHASVCKPNERYRAPWTFVETGRMP